MTSVLMYSLLHSIKWLFRINFFLLNLKCARHRGKILLITPAFGLNLNITRAMIPDLDANQKQQPPLTKSTKAELRKRVTR